MSSNYEINNEVCVGEVIEGLRNKYESSKTFLQELENDLKLHKCTDTSNQKVSKNKGFSFIGEIKGFFRKNDKYKDQGEEGEENTNNKTNEVVEAYTKDTFIFESQPNIRRVSLETRMSMDVNIVNIDFPSATAINRHLRRFSSVRERNDDSNKPSRLSRSESEDYRFSRLSLQGSGTSSKRISMSRVVPIVE